MWEVWRINNTEQIARDHLKERSDYYSQLKVMEAKPVKKASSKKTLEEWNKYYNDTKADADLSPEAFSEKHSPEYPKGYLEKFPYAIQYRHKGVKEAVSKPFEQQIKEHPEMVKEPLSRRIHKFIEKQAPRDSEGNRIRNPKRPVRAAIIGMTPDETRRTVDYNETSVEAKPKINWHEEYYGDSAHRAEANAKKLASKAGSTHFIDTWSGGRGKLIKQREGQTHCDRCGERLGNEEIAEITDKNGKHMIIHQGCWKEGSDKIA
jgi:hypothetical protein